MTYKDILPPEIEIEKTRDINYLFELPRQYGGRFVHEAQNKRFETMLKFSFDTGQKEAMEQFEKKMEESKEK